MLDFHCILIKTVSGCPSKDQSQRRRSVLKRGDGGNLPHSLGPGSLMGKGAKIIGFGGKMGERSQPRGNLGREKGGDILNV